MLQPSLGLRSWGIDLATDPMSRTAYQFSPRHERTGLLRDASTASIANSLGFGHFSPSPGIAGGKQTQQFWRARSVDGVEPSFLSVRP